MTSSPSSPRHPPLFAPHIPLRSFLRFRSFIQIFKFKFK
jgi:hypothetical protein